MCAGVLLHRFATIDESVLHGRGREIPWVGVLMAVGALMLAALPPFTTFMGKSLLEAGSAEVGYGWLIAVFVIVSAVTGGALLRVVGCVFLGWGAAEGEHREQAQVAAEAVDETRGSRDHTPALMVVVPAVLLTAALALGLLPGAVPGVERFAAQFAEHQAYGAWVLHAQRVGLQLTAPNHVSAADYGYGALSTVGALLVAAYGLFGKRVLRRHREPGLRPIAGAVSLIRSLHSGHVGDYIAWWSAGVSLVGGLCLVTLR
jgi:multicomponent Na+:H+ antiporter subunit D